jgi:hypothetical protein
MLALALFSLGGRPTLASPSNDDPLVSQDTVYQLRPSVASHVDTQQVSITKSERFTGCLVVRKNAQLSRDHERRERIRDCEHYLNQDSRFRNVVEQVQFSAQVENGSR